MFLSKRCLYSFGGYAQAQLRRVDNGLVREVPLEKQLEQMKKSMDVAMLKLEDKHLKQIDNYISYLSMTFDEEEVNETVAQIFLTLMYERPLLKNSLSNKAERFLYEAVFAIR